MKSFCIAVAAFVIGVLLVRVKLLAAEFINLVVGQSHVLKVAGASSVAVGDSTVVGVKVLPGGNEVMLTGLQSGTTNFIVMGEGGLRKEYTVRVLATDPRALADAVREALEGVEGVKVRVAGANVILEGEILRKADQELLDRVLAAFPGVISFVKGRRVLPELMVQIDVKAVEISSTSLKEFGFSWPSVFGGEGSATWTMRPGEATGGTGFSLSVVSYLTAALRLLSDAGKVRVLSNPVLVTRNGEKARFLAGGEVPVPAAGSLGQVDIEFREFGVLLEFRARADTYGNVSLDVHVSVSDLDYSRAVQAGGFAVPAIRKRETESRVNLHEGESLAIAELFTESQRKNVSKLPFLGDIPILGELFKKRSFQNGHTRFMMFITPAVLRPGRLPADRIRRILKVYEKWRSEVSAGLLD